jgi:hypothetical protein
LVDEDDGAIGFLDVRGELAQSLAHQTRLQAWQGVTHFAFEFGLGRERGHRVHHDEVHRARAHQAVDDFKGLLAGVGLADEQVLQIDPEFLRVLHIQRMFGVDKRAGACHFLHFSDDLQGQRGFAG